MGNELERIIEFPTPITAEEIDDGLINYLRNKIPCDISYGLIREKKSASFKGNIRRPFDSRIIIPNLRFEISGDYFSPELPIFFFNSIRFETLKYDRIEEKEQLKLLIDEVRQKTQEYFSQRPK